MCKAFSGSSPSSDLHIFWWVMVGESRNKWCGAGSRGDVRFQCWNLYWSCRRSGFNNTPKLNSIFENFLRTQKTQEWISGRPCDNWCWKPCEKTLILFQQWSPGWWMMTRPWFPVLALEALPKISQRLRSSCVTSPENVGSRKCVCISMRCPQRWKFHT